MILAHCTALDLITRHDQPRKRHESSLAAQLLLTASTPVQVTCIAETIAFIAGYQAPSADSAVRESYRKFWPC
jgi:hypothetical protein